MKLELNNVTKSYNDGHKTLKVIENLSIIFESSVQVAILGRSGIGKSTLLHMLGGLDKVTSGSIKINDQDIAKYTNDQLSDFRSKNVGFVFQFHHLLSDFSAQENVAMPLLIQGLNNLEANQRAKEILDMVNLGDRLNHRPGELSGGEQQRVALARSLVHKPGIVLADEPTGSLDESTGKLVQGLLQDVTRQIKATLIVVTHNKELARSFDYVLEMKSGGVLSNV
jgi:lipoprotein-releasing system ATP-binding protein